jgi:leucyl-tRNA synthetase
VFAVVDEAVSRPREDPEVLEHLTHRTIKGVTEDLERFRFNTAISKLQVLSNEMRSALEAGAGAGRAAEALVQLLAPFAPFAAEELWREVLGHGSSVHASSWPGYDPSLAADETLTLVVQVDGKVRDKVEVPPDADDAACLELARGSQKARRAIDGRAVTKEIVRAPRLVNFVTKR